MAIKLLKVTDDSMQHYYDHAEELSQLSYARGLKLAEELKELCEEEDDDVSLIELLGQIGAGWVLPVLKDYLGSEEEETRHVAIFSFLEYGKGDGVPLLIDHFRSEENEELREDIRVVLVGILGKASATLFNFADPKGEEQRINDFWTKEKYKFKEDLCYTEGELVSLKTWIDKLKSGTSIVKNTVSDRLFFWTGQRFPADKDLHRNWIQWWATHQGAYEEGRKYFLGYLMK